MVHNQIIVIHERDCFHGTQKENNLKKDMEDVVNTQRIRAIKTII